MKLIIKWITLSLIVYVIEGLLSISFDFIDTPIFRETSYLMGIIVALIEINETKKEG